MKNLLALFPLVLAALAASASATQARLVPLGFLESGSGSRGHGLNADGTVVVGSAQNNHPDLWANQAVRWTVANQIEMIVNPVVDIGTDLASEVDAVGFQVAGGIFESEYSSIFLWNAPDGWTEFSLGIGFAWLTGMSADGTVLTVATDDTYGGSEAFVGNPARGFTLLGSLPGGNENAAALGLSSSGEFVVGQASSTEGNQAFRWTADMGMQALGFLPSHSGASRAVGVSADGSVVVGGSGSFVPVSQAFRWTETSGMVGLGFLPGGSWSAALDVSDDGAVVVGHADGVPFIWTESLGMVALQEHLAALGAGCLEGWTLTEVAAISADGNAVTGSATNSAGQTEAYVAYFDAPADLPIGGRACSPATPSSTGVPARLTVLGSSCVAADQVVLVVDDLPPEAWGILLAAPAAGQFQNPLGGEGLLCLGRDIERLGPGGFPADPAGHVSRTLALPSTPIVAGTSWHFQAAYRDVNPGPTSNLSDSVVVTFR